MQAEEGVTIFDWIQFDEVLITEDSSRPKTNLPPGRLPVQNGRAARSYPVACVFLFEDGQAATGEACRLAGRTGLLRGAGAAYRHKRLFTARLGKPCIGAGCSARVRE